MTSAGIIGTGSFIPPKILTNDDFVKQGLETSHDWIVERTGIIERHVVQEETSSEMGYYAAQQALDSSGLSPQDIDIVIVATSTPDNPGFPSTACLIQKRLGLRPVPAFDLSAACTGFTYALTTAAQFIETGFSKHALVVATDRLSKYVDRSDRSLCILFGDGAGAVVLGKVPRYGIITSTLYAEGGHADILTMDATPLIHMNGKAVFKVAIEALVPAVLDALNRACLTVSDITWFIPHQANLRIMEYAREKLGLRRECMLVNIHKYGNTSAASIPIAYNEAVRENKIKSGDIVVMVGFGAGFTWGVTILRHV